MWIKVFQRFISGIACGGISMFIALTVLMFNDITPDISLLWFYMLMAFVIGVYFALASFIFELDQWSPLKKTIIHFSLSVIVYFPIAMSIGWIPVSPLSIILSLVIFIVCYILFWTGFNLYFKKVEASLNENLRKK